MSVQCRLHTDTDRISLQYLTKKFFHNFILFRFEDGFRDNRSTEPYLIQSTIITALRFPHFIHKKFIVISGELKIPNHQIQVISTPAFPIVKKPNRPFSNLTKKKSNLQLNILN